MSSPLIETERQDGVLTLRFNRADKKNALTQEMYTTMAETVESATADPTVRTLLFVGSGGVFCAGNDIQDFLNVPADAADNPVLRFMLALAKFPKPVVAAVTGPAVGIGATLLLHCDLVYVGKGARLQFPFVNIGICPEYASTYLLPRIMGHVRAAELVMFGDPFTAQKALECGLVNEVLDDDAVDARARERATRLARQAPKSLRVTKMLLKRWREDVVLEAIDVEAEHFVPMLREPEATEAITAFVQKRKPDFSRFS